MGEFGWQLMSWQGYVRKQAVGYDEVIVCGPSQHAALYADFATQYIPYDTHGQRNCWWIKPRDNVEANMLDNMLAGHHPGDRLRPMRRYHAEEQTFVPFGSAGAVPPERRFDVIMHVRNPIGQHPEHAWPKEHSAAVADGLLSHGYKVAATGVEAHCPPGATNLLGLPLAQALDIYAAAQVIIGPCSGPIHLAALCKLPAIVWTDRRYWSMVGMTNRHRLERGWNPFKTTAVVIDDAEWLPAVSRIVESVTRFLGRGNHERTGGNG